MKHFSLTPKSLGAYLVAFGMYVGEMGHFPETPKQWGIAVGAFALSILNPKTAGDQPKDAG